MPHENARVILNALGGDDVKKRTYVIAEKFLNWAPLIEQDSSFHGELASAWSASHSWMCGTEVRGIVGVVAPQYRAYLKNLPKVGEPNPACDVVDSLAMMVNYDEVVMEEKPTPLDSSIP